MCAECFVNIICAFAYIFVHVCAADEDDDA